MVGYWLAKLQWVSKQLAALLESTSLPVACFHWAGTLLCWKHMWWAARGPRWRTQIEQQLSILDFQAVRWREGAGLFVVWMVRGTRTTARRTGTRTTRTSSSPPARRYQHWQQTQKGETKDTTTRTKNNPADQKLRQWNIILKNCVSPARNYNFVS